MPQPRPYRRNCRQFVDGTYANSGQSQYIQHDRYAQSAEHYVRAFLILQQDLLKLFESVEPADQNLTTYSFRIHELLMRASIEVEANCKAILTENGYTKAGNWNILDYQKINVTHHLSSYEIKLPVWNGASHTFRPFASWAGPAPTPLIWYQRYNETKHDRHANFHDAQLQYALHAICGLAVLLASQFYTHDFASTPSILSLSDHRSDGMECAIGGYFRIRFPNDFTNAEKYDFDWKTLSAAHADPFLNYPYPP